MKTKKQILALLMVVVMAFSVYGCASNGDANQPSQQPNNELSAPTEAPEQSQAPEETEAPGDGGDTEMSETMAKIKESGKIVWGTNAAFPPFEVRKGDDVIWVDA